MDAGRHGRGRREGLLIPRRGSSSIALAALAMISPARRPKAWTSIGAGRLSGSHQSCGSSLSCRLSGWFFFCGMGKDLPSPVPSNQYPADGFRSALCRISSKAARALHRAALEANCRITPVPFVTSITNDAALRSPCPAPLRGRGEAARALDDRPTERERACGLATPFLRFLIRNCSNTDWRPTGRLSRGTLDD